MWWKKWKKISYRKTRQSGRKEEKQKQPVNFYGWLFILHKHKLLFSLGPTMSLPRSSLHLHHQSSSISNIKCSLFHIIYPPSFLSNHPSFNYISFLIFLSLFSSPSYSCLAHLQISGLPICLKYPTSCKVSIFILTSAFVGTLHHVVSGVLLQQGLHAFQMVRLS